eukprot:TRINITY_DN54473_c0_g1_i1.p1 TRINITY_DN54473_c0_g1~~TRINITY_DN54473_c0_g1_i1.p1  ORF type:complete len:501 (-),score=71.99 TRINITY_DN54473_c0_g1_i1:249-1673(-)
MANDLLQCPICFETFNQPQLLGQCGHTFCKLCIEGILASQRTTQCPTCRRPFRRDTVLPNFALNHLLRERENSHAPGSSETAPTTQTHGRHDVAGAGSVQGDQFEGSLAREIVSTPASVASLMSLGLPAGLARLVSDEDCQIAVRIFLLDNSGSTSACDGNILDKDSMRFRKCTRWDEIKHIALEHARWNMQVGTPCEFVLLNPAFSGNKLEEGVDFQRIDASKGDCATQLAALERLLKNTSPTGTTPLAARIRKIRLRIAAEARNLALNGQKVVLVIATDGLPTNESSMGDERAKRELVEELRQTGTQLPVHLVVRLCTDEDDVVDFYNSIDEEVELQLEVIDDIKGEAREARKSSNHWLTYSPVVHHLREGGTFLKIFDLLDERKLEPVEICMLCQLLLRQDESDEPLPSDPEAFCEEVKARLRHIPAVYDPLLEKMMPPVIIDELQWAVLPKSPLRRHCGNIVGYADCSLM